LEQNKLNATTFDLVQHFNVTHVYVGVKVCPWDNYMHRWDPVLFLGNPNFELVKNFGNAYLFKFELKNARISLMDSFEYTQLEQGGWQIVEEGDNEGNATITSNVAFEGSNSLMLSARSNNESQSISVLRKVYAGESGDVKLSFYLNATTGFGSGDYIMFKISDSVTNKHIYFVTNPPSGIKSSLVRLSNSEGFFEFNLSTLWKDLLGERMPKSFYVQITNYDADGIENTAYIDQIVIENP
jgi:hypothetical protein